MSHYICEIIIPPGHDVVEAVQAILAPYSENLDANDDVASGHPFWDFYMIGGRFAGRKAECGLDQGKLKDFRKWMIDEKVMVQGLVCGKEELATEEMRVKVDAKWREMFPGGGPKCTLFRHSNDQYANDEWLPGDVMPLADLPKGLSASRVIIAAPGWVKEGWNGKLRATFMIQGDFWNGVTWVDTTWDGKVQSAIDQHESQVKKHGTDDYIKVATPTGEWVAITVDYHT